jgi:hypothetical protein
LGLRVRLVFLWVSETYIANITTVNSQVFYYRRRQSVLAGMERLDLTIPEVQTLTLRPQFDITYTILNSA